jgi:hypothetical protein
MPMMNNIGASLYRTGCYHVSMRKDTALRRLEKRANEFFGMTLEEYLNQFVYFNFNLNRYVLNENQSMQECWYRLGAPVNLDMLWEKY